MLDSSIARGCQPVKFMCLKSEPDQHMITCPNIDIIDNSLPRHPRIEAMAS